MLMKNSTDNIGEQTRDLLACSAVPQPTVSPRAAKEYTKEDFKAFTGLDLPVSRIQGKNNCSQ